MRAMAATTAVVTDVERYGFGLLSWTAVGHCDVLSDAADLLPIVDGAGST